jgi:imidazolonepropionase-like amidohydrolase
MVELGRLREERRRALVDRFFVPGLADRAARSLRHLGTGRPRMFGVVDARPFIAYYAPAVDHGIRNFRRLFRAGARIALGNDGGVPPCTPAMVGLELAIMDLALRGDGPGLSGADALRIATLASAEAIGLAGEAGSLCPGKRADLAVFDGDPLADFTRIGEPVAALFLGGELVVDRCGLA